METAVIATMQIRLPAAPRSFRDRNPQIHTHRGRSPISTPVTLWRPWITTSRDAQRNRSSCPYARAAVPSDATADGKSQPFQHPVRLFWPKSKSYDYLYSDGEALLRNFPVQATISFYDESDSEEDEEDDDGDYWEEEGDADSKPVSHITS